MNNLTSKEEMMRRIEELEQALYEERRKKAVTRYGLIWEDSPEKLDDPNIVPLLSIDTDEYLKRFIKGNELNKDILMDKEKPMNYLIEGDNYHSLKALERTHTGKIDVIYIDPPYNTGNEFVYNDKIVDKEDGYRHSKWLSFMSKRLEIARRLMSDDGVIFVSIDDNEVAQLKLLMDSVFGENNKVSINVWENKEGGGKSDSLFYRNRHEYILVYLKDRDLFLEKYKEGFNNIGITNIERYKERDKWESSRGKYQLQRLNVSGIRYSETLDYPIEAPNGDILYPNEDGKKEKTWRWGKEKLAWGIENDFIVFKKDSRGKYQVYTKQYLKVDNNNRPINRGHRPLATITGYSTIQSAKELREIFNGHKVFDYSKPKGLIKWLLNRVPGKNITVLDFFAGSGTTGHAVLELNKEDGGNRQFILCTNNEVSEEKVRNHFYEQGLIPKPNKTEFRKFEKENPDQVLDFTKSDEYQELGIARSVTYERLRKVIEGYTTPKGKDVAGIPANLMYLTTKEYTKEDVRRAREEGRFVDTTEMYAGIFYLKYPRTTHTVMFVTDDLSFNNFKGIDTLPTDNVVIVLSGLDYPHETANIIRKEVKTKNLIFEHLRY